MSTAIVIGLMRHAWTWRGEASRQPHARGAIFGA